MKVWVETDNAGLASFQVFASRENVVQYWKNVFPECAIVAPEREPTVRLVYQGHTVRGAVEVEVDDYFVNKEKNNADNN